MSSLAERASIIPGRVMTRSKAIFGQWGDGAYGSTIYGDDGRVYLDMLCALGAVTLGYGYGPCDDEYWGVTSLPDRLEVEAAEAVLAHVAPWASSVRFTVTGSEATHAAYRIAKAATGRSTVLAWDGSYHGWHEWCADRGPLVGESGGRVSEKAMLQYRYNKFLRAPNPQDIAAVFVEPSRWEATDLAWLRSVREFCDRIGALLVFDSMIYGGRFALGGASAYFGVQPDLETFGKAFGNGLPASFVVGNEALASHGEMVSGTFSGFPGGLRAVVDTIKAYTTLPVIDTLWTRGRQLQEGLRAIVPADLGFCEGEPVHQRIRFVDSTHGPRFTAAMLDRGILWHHACSNVMYAHTEQDIERVIVAAKESVETLR